ncbi:MAG: hypothetical protein IPM29_00545 [Planctomycetes bacterium]|nr:hypothetical protein [Planctomycetota bacterium]
MTYDSQRGRVILCAGVSLGAYLADTWEWDGANWTQFASGGPTARYRHALAYDSQRDRVVLFGGYNAGIRFGDTWEWDGNVWTLVAATGPTPRYGHALVYDSRRGRVILFGGSTGSARLADTWAWDGSTWTLLANGGPPARYLHSMAYDEQRDRVVLFGGMMSTSSNYLDDTWEWDGNAWSQAAAAEPSPRASCTLAYSPQRGRVVMFGGYEFDGGGYTYGAGTWEWNGRKWSQLVETGPALRRDSAMAYDGQRGTLVMFGGTSPTGYLGDTWEYDLPATLSWLRSPHTGHWYGRTVPLNWWGAEAEAERYGGHLATIRSPTEQNWLVAIFGTGDTWIGLNDEQVERTFVWTSGEPVAYTNWAPGQPNNSGSGEDHTILWSQAGGRWDDTDGSRVLPGLVELVAHPSNGHIYTSTPTSSWEEAELTAVQLGGHLATVRSQAEQDRLTQRFGQRKWIGLNDAAVEGSWRWSSGEPVAFTAWRAGDPDNDRNEDYAYIGAGPNGEWDDGWGGGWVADSPAVAMRDRHGLTYDPVRQRVVLFGGRGPSAVYTNETWEWDGTGWRVVAIGTPSPRGALSLAYDPSGAVLTFGGWNGAQFLSDTYRWNGSSWQQAAVTGPSAREHYALASTAGGVLLCGGNDGVSSNHCLADTWWWDSIAQRWVDESASVGTPGARCDHAVAFDPQRNRHLLFGGVNDTGTALGDTWELMSVWSRVSASGPSPRYGHRMVFDEMRGRVVLYGGSDNTKHFDDTWEWDADDRFWRRIPGSGPPARFDHAMAYDSRIGETLLIGGTIQVAPGIANDTWRYDSWELPGIAEVPPRAAYALFGAGCRGSNGAIPALRMVPGRERPLSGTVFRVRIEAVPANTAVTGLIGLSDRYLGGSWPLPLALGFAGMPGCVLFVDPLVSSPMYASAGGTVDWDVPMPSDPALYGVTFFQQALVADRNANQLGVVMTNAGKGTLGAW